MNRPGLTNGLLTAALVACGLLVAALAYGFATRTLTPRTAPTLATAPGTGPTAADTTGQARELAAARARITVEIRNAAGVNGLAARARTLLIQRGFDVLEVGTARSADSSSVASRTGTREDAAHVAGALGLPARRVVAGDSSDENAATVAVTLGRDYTDFPTLRALR